MSGGNAYKRKSHRRIEVITSVAAVVVLHVMEMERIHQGLLHLFFYHS